MKDLNNLILAVIFVIAAVLPSGCRDDRKWDDRRGGYDENRPVSFITRIDAGTRGTPINDASKVSTMGLFCAASGSNDWNAGATLDKMFNRHLVQKAGKWTYVGSDVRWDAKTNDYRYSFFAYAPSDSTGADGKSLNGIIINGAESDVGIPTLMYTVPDDVTRQPDLMVAVPKYNERPSDQPVELNMKHALTCVGFQLSGKGEKVTGVSITGISFEGTLTIDGESIRWSGLPTPTTEKDFSASINYDAGANFFTAQASMSDNLIADNGFLMMIPQTLTDNARINIHLDDGDIREVKLNSQTWEPGKKVIYKFAITPGGTIELSVLDLAFPYYQTSGFLRVNCLKADGSEYPQGKWMLKTDDAWIRLSFDPTGTNAAASISGEGSKEVYIFIDENPADSPERSGSIQLVDVPPPAGVVNIKQGKRVVVSEEKAFDPPPTFTPYAGAFWKADQKGERIIRMNVGADIGTWSAKVLKTDIQWGTGNGVVLANFTEDDAKRLVNPGNAENNPVTTDDTQISGTTTAKGEIVFRIGLKTAFGAYHADNNPARYAVILLTYNNDTKYLKIFIRQGEGADYLMRPKDIPDGGDVANRNYSRKFAAYNLKDPQNGSGGTDFSAHGTVYPNAGKFVDYPSQAGYFFKWGITSWARAFHPVNPGTADLIIGWNVNIPGYWVGTLKADNEVSPTGYRRPTDGPNDSDVDGEDISLSEIRQSLMLKPKKGTNIDLSNSAWGYYADGFFDQLNANLNEPLRSRVSENDSKIACAGRLFINYNTNASLFFPAAGFRSRNDGTLNIDNMGHYWTSSTCKVQTGEVWGLQLGETSAEHAVVSNDHAYSVRSVKDE